MGEIETWDKRVCLLQIDQGYVAETTLLRCGGAD